MKTRKETPHLCSIEDGSKVDAKMEKYYHLFWSWIKCPLRSVLPQTAPVIPLLMPDSGSLSGLLTVDKCYIIDPIHLAQSIPRSSHMTLTRWSILGLPALTTKRGHGLVWQILVPYLLSARWGSRGWDNSLSRIVRVLLWRAWKRGSFCLQITSCEDIGGGCWQPFFPPHGDNRAKENKTD